MGRTVPTFRNIIELFGLEWNDFKRALRYNDKKTFEELLNHARKHGAAGTNIILQNGVAAGQEIPHICVHIIPRNEGDGLDFQWEPKRLTEEQMSAVELKVKEASGEVGKFEDKEKKKPIKIEKKVKKVKADDDKENYMIKQLERIP